MSDRDDRPSGAARARRRWRVEIALLEVLAEAGSESGVHTRTLAAQCSAKQSTFWVAMERIRAHGLAVFVSEQRRSRITERGVRLLRLVGGAADVLPAEDRRSRRHAVAHTLAAVAADEDPWLSATELKFILGLGRVSVSVAASYLVRNGQAEHTFRRPTPAAPKESFYRLVDSVDDDDDGDGWLELLRRLLQSRRLARSP
jgi:hypothetical protein